MPMKPTDAKAIICCALAVGLAPSYRMKSSVKSEIARRFRWVSNMNSFIADLESDIDAIIRDKEWELKNPMVKYRGPNWHRRSTVTIRIRFVKSLAKTYQKNTGRNPGCSYSHRLGCPSGPFVELVERAYKCINIFVSRETIKGDIRKARRNL